MTPAARAEYLRSPGRLSTALIFVAVFYIVAAKFGLASAIVHPSATAVWPPTGVALAALILFGFRLWPGVFLGAFFANITTAGSIGSSLGIATGNTLEAIAGTYLVNRFAAGHRAFERPQDVLKFAVLAGCASTAISATVGATTLALGGLADFADYGAIWFTWWLGDLGGALIVAPLLILWGSNPRFSLARQELGERCIVFAFLAGAGYLAFGLFPAEGVGTPSVAFLIIPILLWVAIRFSRREAATAVFLASAIAVWGTLKGAGPFVREDPNESLLLLQQFGATLALMILTIAAAIYSRNRSEVSLRSSEETARARLAELQTIYRSAPVGLGLTDRDLRFLSVNETLAEIDGIPAAEHIGRTLSELVPAPLAQTLEPLYRRVLETGEPVLNVEVQGETRANPGLTRTWTVNYHPVVRDRAIAGVSLMVQEITERKRAEERLAEASRRQAALYQFVERRARAESFEEMYEAALDAIISVLCCDRAAILLRSGTGAMSFVRWRGLSDRYRKAVEGHSPWKADESKAQPVYCTDVAAAAFEPWLKESILAEGVGALAFVPLLFEGGLGGKFAIYYNEPHRFTQEEVDLSVNIGQQLVLGINRMRAEHGLREADRRKDEFLSMIGHELRNPLNVIGTSTQLLHINDLDEANREELRDSIEQEVKHMARLLDDLLDVSRIARGLIRLAHEPCDLAAIVRQVVESRRHNFEESGLSLSLFLPERETWVIGDSTRLTQIVVNLLDNANKFTPSGGRITLRLVDEQTAGMALLTIRDTGIGIAPETLSRIFDPFVQADRTFERSRGGLGLGLALVKSLVELQGGQVKARSQGLGRGAEFALSFPLVQKPAALSAPAERAAKTASAWRILVMEDNLTAARNLRVFLTRIGHEVALAHDGRNGTELAGRFQPDIVLCDIGLPGMDGYAVARALRKNPDLARTYMIAVSGYGQEDDKRRALEAGFDLHMTKPIDLSDLATILGGLEMRRV